MHASVEIAAQGGMLDVKVDWPLPHPNG
jgi:hypothetical protein